MGIQQFMRHERLIGVVGVAYQWRHRLGRQVHGGGNTTARAGSVVVVEQFWLPVILGATVHLLVIVQSADRAGEGTVADSVLAVGACHGLLG
jgi:hypothetical protein